MVEQLGWSAQETEWACRRLATLACTTAHQVLLPAELDKASLQELILTLSTSIQAQLQGGRGMPNSLAWIRCDFAILSDQLVLTNSEPTCSFYIRVNAETIGKIPTFQGQFLYKGRLEESAILLNHPNTSQLQ